jgi:hypothetical protein
MLINDVMTKLTLHELAAIAVALGEEEDAERKRRRWAVHLAWSKREIEGEFVTLYKCHVLNSGIFFLHILLISRRPL